jgi:hypothetical protein
MQYLITIFERCKILYLLALAFFCFVTSSTSYSQINVNGLPFIRNFSPKEYNEHPQNWSIVKDKRGVMYFGK